MKKFCVYTLSNFDTNAIKCLRLLYNSIIEQNNIDDFDFYVVTNKPYFEDLGYVNCKIIQENDDLDSDLKTEYFSSVQAKYSPNLPDGYEYYVFLDSDILFYEKLQNIKLSESYTIGAAIELSNDNMMFYSPFHKYEGMGVFFVELAKKTRCFNAGQFVLKSCNFKNEFFAKVRNLFKQYIEFIDKEKVHNIAFLEQQSFNYAVLHYLDKTDTMTLTSKVSCVPEAARDAQDFNVTICHFVGIFNPNLAMSDKYQRMINYMAQRQFSSNHRDRISYYKNRSILMQSYIERGMVGAEIGVFQGSFSKVLLSFDPKILFLVDLFDGITISGDEDKALYGREHGKVITANLSEEYKKLGAKYSADKRVILIKNEANQFLQNLPDNFLDFVYIDADHNYEAMKSNLHFSYQKVKNGGYIMGHDYMQTEFPGVVYAVDEFCRERKLEINALSLCAYPTFCIEVKNKL